MWHKLNQLLPRDRRIVWIVALLILAAVAYADYATGIEYNFSLFYIIPVALVTWRAGMASGFAMSILAAGAWVGADLLPRWRWGLHFARPRVTFWNAVICLDILILVTWALAELRRALDEERATSRIKSDLISLVSHEFNNSLTSMGMALLLLRDNDSSPEQRRDIYLVLERIHRVLKATVGNFLNQARMKSGRFQLDIKHIELRRVVRETLELMLPLSEQKELELRLEFPEKPIPVNADPDALALVMSNLIGNAIKYTPQKGRVVVRMERAGPAAEVEVSVLDNGIGIAAQDQQAIFQGYYRTKEGIKSAKGFGVGLMISRELLESHDSSLKVESAPGQGSRFYFRLPVCSTECPNRNAGLCHRCRRRNPAAWRDSPDGGAAVKPAGTAAPPA